MRRFLGSVSLAALAAAILLTAGSATAAPAETRESSPSIWQALVDLVRPIFGASDGDGSPEFDPDGLTAPPPGSNGGEGSGNADGSPEIDPDG